MKRIIYPCITFLFSAMLICGTAVNAQTYLITYPHPDPTDNSPNGPLDHNDFNGQGIETGVRFYVTQPGTVTGIRFLKGTPNTGVHIGHLWTNDGSSKLAEATFSETANGWQEVAVSVHIVSGTKFVASVFSVVGDYSDEDNTTTQTWQDQGGADYGTAPIKVVAYSNDPAHNGIYIYTNSANGAFPNQDGGASNYWIGIRFLPDFSLPVSLSDFKATVNTNDVLLTWKTDFENNNRGFEIERSNDGSNWYPLNFVNGTGQSSIIKNYNYTDRKLAPGVYYYRLRQTDYDGKNTFSSIISAAIAGKGSVSLFQNYPNPFNGTSTIRFDLPATQKVKLSIIDITGREVKVLTNKMSEAGSHQVTIDASNLQKQIYLVRLQTENGVLTKSILVE